MGSMKIQSLVSRWEASMPFQRTTVKFLDLDEETAAGYLLWINGGCADTTLAIVDASLEHCDAGLYAWWWAVRNHITEAQGE